MASKDQNRRRNLLAAIACLVLVVFGAVTWNKLCTAEEINSTGPWSFYYFYSNDSSLIYKGTVALNLDDSLSANFEIYAPKSRRAELIAARNLRFDREGRTLSGDLLHDRYKIREGHMLESFEWTFGDADQFAGTGKCREFCAEGTERSEITWTGFRGVSE